MKRSIGVCIIFLLSMSVLSCEIQPNQTGSVDSDDDNNYLQSFGIWNGTVTRFLMRDYQYYWATNTFESASIHGDTISVFYFSFYEEETLHIKVSYPDNNTVILEETVTGGTGLLYNVLSNFSPFTYDWNNQLFVTVKRDDFWQSEVIHVDW